MKTRVTTDGSEFRVAAVTASCDLIIGQDGKETIIVAAYDPSVAMAAEHLSGSEVVHKESVDIVTIRPDEGALSPKEPIRNRFPQLSVKTTTENWLTDTVFSITHLVQSDFDGKNGK